jgi:phage-related protein
LIAALPEIIISIVDFIVKSIPEIIQAGTKLLVSLITNLPTIITEIVKAIPQIVTGIFEAFTNPETLAQIADAGMQLIYGLWDGICSVGQWLFDMVGDFFGGIGDFVCGIFGIHSPSKVFADIGKNLMLGMEEGIDGEEQDLLKDVNSLAGEISDAMTVSGNVNLAGTNGNKAKTGSIINIYPQELDNSTVDYLFQRFNAQMGATV